MGAPPGLGAEWLRSRWKFGHNVLGIPPCQQRRIPGQSSATPHGALGYIADFHGVTYGDEEQQ